MGAHASRQRGAQSACGEDDTMVSAVVRLVVSETSIIIIRVFP